ncbi:TonB-dependent receptor [Bacteroides cellulosilyticus]|jgi:TonB-linked SusC/RagA family outer membrane protein|uniref:TonB-dependent receptor n=3 Tax=Bacteroides cellulosilyticus TaxID=246787 RepID=A0A125MGW4_9BACE|nr:TonB-dependent receptor [Bacteroides cellulosilyticus]KWR58452.1 ferrienterobactin receptor precursor [Bacteroides cellulosilyticus]MBX9087250.1 TonB-dependent receptor [Bacteroides cellulosilyticus]QUT89973.1 TonB-dependent receptor P26 [Bacteroides cellulosilyticus]HCY71201.1 TonB-dependent receptor [Bacteroides cellulosilyticus]
MFNLKVYAMKKQRFFEELRLKVCVTLAVCMALLLNAPFLGAQNSTIKVKGVVNDAMGPVIGASIVEKGNTGNGTITDIDGNFSLNVSSNSTLIVSFVGYKAQEIPVAGKTFFTIDLKEDNEMLEEVVVVGFATQKKVNLTGSVGTATAKDIEARPVANAVQALQGVIPGLNISNSGNGGELNATKSIDVRGTGTVGKDASGNAFSSGSPLILIDGMEGDLNSINPQDIESISVLKDAAASSIYGSRAPFGVVLVTTKSGKSGRAQINYNMNMRYSTPIKMPDMANSYEFVNLFDDAEYNGSGKHLYTDEYRQFVYDFMTGKSDDYIWGNGSGGKWNYDYSANNVNWLKEYYRNTAPSQEHNVSVSGGSDKMTYYLSANYMTQEGFMRYGTEDYDRYTITAKISAQLTKALKVDYSNRWVRTDYERPTYMNDDFYNHILRRARPVRAVYDPNGYLMSDINYIGVMRDGGRHNEQKDAMAQQLKITVTPLKNWNIIGEMNIKTDNNWNHWEQFVVYSHYKDNPENTYTALTSANKDQVSEYSLKTTYLNPTVYSNYNFSLKEKHNFTILGGFQAEIMKYRDMEGARTGLVTTDLPVLNLTTDADSYTLKGLYKNWKNAGFFGRINYDYNGKYLVEGNLRYDGSSRFRRGNRWILTPSFSLGWNVARENFWEKLADVVEVFKLRVSYGELANQNTTSWYPTYQTLGVTTNGGKWLQNGALTSVASVPGLISTSLSWEKIKNTNIGFDFGALNNRLTGSFDYFWRKTKNMVGPGVELPAILGATVPSTNNTDLTTFGWELSIGWRDKVGELGYGVKLNISDNQTRIDKYPNPTNSLSKYMAGELTGDIYGYTTIGIAKTQEEMDAHIASLPKGGQTAIGSKWEAGDIMYADINGDGKIDNGSNTLDDMGDLKKIGNNTPRFRTGITLDAQWKGFDFSMFWQGVLKRDFDPGENSMVFWGTTGSGQWWSTSFKDHMDYFRAEDTASPLGANVNAYYPRPLFNNKNHKTQTAYLQNAAYMRLKNLQLGYTLPKSLINKIGLQNVRVYVSGENLLTITGLSDTMDPETAGIGKQGGTVYPLSRVYSFGLSVNF